MGALRRPGYHSPTVIPYDEFLFLSLQNSYNMENTVSEEVLTRLRSHATKTIDSTLVSYLSERSDFARHLQDKRTVLEQKASQFFQEEMDSASLWKGAVLELNKQQQAKSEYYTDQILKTAKFIGLVVD
jgi:hypothetical protein